MAASRCCKCMSSGVCVACSCARQNSHCSNCYPSRIGRCRNLPDISDDSRSSSILDPPLVDPDRHIEPRVVRVPRSQESSFTSTPVIATAPPNQDIVGLPSFRPLSPPNFCWGNLTGEECVELINRCYSIAVHWIPNLFKLPSGKQGKSFIKELTRLFRLYSEESAMECIALKATFLFPLLVLQKPHRRSKNKEHNIALERRLNSWLDGSFVILLNEGKTIQKQFKNARHRTAKKPDFLRQFSNYMFDGKVKAALRILNENGSRVGQPLSLSSPLSASDPSQGIVRDALIKKHPDPGPVSSAHCLLSETPPPDHEPHVVNFGQIDAILIRRTILQMDGAAGPSGMDVSSWKRLCSSFGRESEDLCESIASIARKLCGSYVDPVGVEALMASRLIALSKDPGVRPIGVGEVCRRLIGKVAIAVIRDEVIDIAGCQQLCAGQRSSCEAIVHCVRKLYCSGEAEGILCVDASNAFNALNRGLALRNILHLCPSFGRLLINTYRSHSSLFINGDCILSKEGTTQGDPLAMSMFAVASIPLINELDESSNVKQFWYADDATAVGDLKELKTWWNKIKSLGKPYGYFPNAAKTVLLVSEEKYDRACSYFAGSDVIVRSDGINLLGVPIGSEAFVESQLKKKLESWISDLKLLSTVAASQPQAANAAFVHGVYSRWNYLFRSCPIPDVLLCNLEEKIRFSFIVALTGRSSISDLEREWLALPNRHGGMGLINPIQYSGSQHKASLAITQPLVDCLLNGEKDFSYEAMMKQLEVINECSSKKAKEMKMRADLVRERLDSDRQRLMDVARERGASVWLSALPLKEFGFDLHKGSFRDAICIRYGWQPPQHVCVVRLSMLIMLSHARMVVFPLCDIMNCET